MSKSNLEDITANLMAGKVFLISNEAATLLHSMCGTWLARCEDKNCEMCPKIAQIYGSLDAMLYGGAAVTLQPNPSIHLTQ